MKIYRYIDIYLCVYVYYVVHVYTHPDCVRVEDVCVTISRAMEEDRACCELWLQLGPIMPPWLCGCCSGSVWGWCSCDCG